jgi:hypothetical protein
MVYRSMFGPEWVTWHPNCPELGAFGRHFPTQPEALAAALAHIRTHHQPEEKS